MEPIVWTFDHNTLTLFTNYYKNKPVEELSVEYVSVAHPDTLRQYRVWLSLSSETREAILLRVSGGRKVIMTTTFS